MHEAPSRSVSCNEKTRTTGVLPRDGWHHPAPGRLSPSIVIGPVRLSPRVHRFLADAALDERIIFQSIDIHFQASDFVF